jgi:2-dehydro-3-deoxyphosphogluconate aldolase/(4S)-4-hydroxy-2-oxoglutarate aldolase
VVKHQNILSNKEVFMNIMTKQKTLDELREAGLVAVIRGPSPEVTLKMVDALIAGGVKGIEITFSTPNAAEVTKSINQKYGTKIILGMGTLTEPKQVAEAKEAGVRFLVSPVCEPKLGAKMVASGLVVMIGALTPTEVLQAYKLGSDVVKIFPGSIVGPGYIKSLKGPFPNIPLMPTGGVSVANVDDWFAAGVFGVGAGSELCPAQLAKDGKFDQITELARTFVAAVTAARTKS